MLAEQQVVRRALEKVMDKNQSREALQGGEKLADMVPAVGHPVAGIDPDSVQ